MAKEYVVFQENKIWHRMIIRKIYPGEITKHKLKNHKEMLRQKRQRMYKVQVKVENISGNSQKKNETLNARRKKRKVRFSPENIRSKLFFKYEGSKEVFSNF